MEINHYIKNYWWVIVLGIISIVVIAFIIGNFKMNRKITKEVEMLMVSSEKEESSIIQEKDLEGLPKPVQRWLSVSGVVGQERIRAISFSQRGEMKLDPEQEKWMEPVAKQYVRVDKPGYLWHVDLPMIPYIAMNLPGKIEDPCWWSEPSFICGDLLL